MFFDESYFDAGFRDGYFVRSMMKRYWAAQLEVIKVIDEICRRHDIKYFMYYGTLLGAVRHKGFIPWDDDTDLGMLRADYMRFLKFAEDELPEGYHIYNVNKSIEYPTRIVNSANMILMNSEHLEKFHGCPYPAGVDIFVFDNLADDEDEREEVLGIMNTVISWSMNLKWRLEKDGDMEMDSNDLEIRDYLESISGVNLKNKESLIENLAFLGDRIAAMYYDAPGKQVANVRFLAQGKKKPIPTECFRECVYIPFENMNLPAPIDYEKILTLEYGDYMTPVVEYTYHEYGFEEEEKQLFRTMEERGLDIPEWLKK